MAQPPELDNVARKFLGVTDPSKVKVVKGQTANAEKQRKLYEQQLMHEACEFGDTLVGYVGAHEKLTLGQRVVSVTLALLNLRRDFPDGVQRFDEYVDLGGDDLKLEPVPPSDKPQGVLASADFLPAAKFAETLVGYVIMTKHQLGLSNPQGAYGLGRMFHTLRGHFPTANGGPLQFDALAAQAGEYFNRG